MKKINIPLFTILCLAGLLSLSFKDIHKKVVCFGDSITYGGKVHSWVSYLSETHGNKADFINAGRSGRRTADREDLITVLKTHPDADYYLIFLGVNDLKDGTDSMVNNCIVNMTWMIGKVRETNATAKIVLLSPCGINLNTMSDLNKGKKYNENTAAALVNLEKRYKALAKEQRIGFMSLLHTVSPKNYTDGLHPDSLGQMQIAVAVWKKGLVRMK